MINIFTSVLMMSLQATIVAGIVIIIKRILDTKINSRISYLLWLIVIMKLLFPILPASPISIFNAINIDTPLPQINSISSDSKIATNESPLKTSNISSIPNIPTPFKEYLSQNTFLLLSYLWALGALLVITYLFLVNLLFSLKISKMNIIEPHKALVDQLKSSLKIHQKITFVESSEITSPCVFGVIRPVIILPKGLLESSDENTLSHIIAHEFAHIKNYDLCVSWLMSILCAIHWFNPVVWYCSKLVKQEQEICADTHVMALLPEDDISGYGQTLLSIVKHSRRQPKALMSAGITENKNTIKQRIKNIATFSKKSSRITLIGILLILFTVTILGTTGMNYPKTGEESMQFGDNLMMSFSSDNASNPRNFELQIHNFNRLSVNSCQIEIYDGNPYKSGSNQIFNSKKFRVPGKKFKSFNLENVDYNSAYVKFKYSIGFSLNKSNSGEQSGDLRFFDKTVKLSGWKEVSEDEVQTFIKKENIKPIQITKIYGFYTIILFENGNSAGYYELYKDSKSGTIQSRRLLGFYDINEDQPPVQLLGGTASGNYPFINFKINSLKILALGDKIEVQTANGTITTYVMGQAAHTIETRGYGNIGKILIYDKNNNIIYDGEKSLIQDVTFKPDDPGYYVPNSNYSLFDTAKKEQIRNMVYDRFITLPKSKEKITSEEVYATVGLKGQEVMNPDTNKLIDITGKNLYCVVFHTELDGLLGPIITYIDPVTEKIIGQALRL